MFEVPNLDCVDDDELRTLRDVFGRLRDYAKFTLYARQMRRTGDVNQAVERERENDKLYRSLPDWARW